MQLLNNEILYALIHRALYEKASIGWEIWMAWWEHQFCSVVFILVPFPYHLKKTLSFSIVDLYLFYPWTFSYFVLTVSCFDLLCFSNQTETMKQCNSQLKKLQTNLSTKQVEKTSTSTQLRQKEDELRQMEDKITSVCDSQDLDTEFAEVSRVFTSHQLRWLGCPRFLGVRNVLETSSQLI